MPFFVRPESTDDPEQIHSVHRMAFGQRDEAQLVDDLREGGHSVLSLVALVDDCIVGHVLFSPIRIVGEQREIDGLALAPVAVLPDYQGQGIGSALIRAGLSMAREQGHHIVIVLGEPAYYRRFGFRPELTKHLSAPYAGEAFMALELLEGALHGVSGDVVYSPPFHRF
jgi:putative acetyltransferase